MVEISGEDSLLILTVVLVAFGVIGIYYDARIPFESKFIVMLGVGIISAIIFNTIKINKIEKELDSLRRKRTTK